MKNSCLQYLYTVRNGKTHNCKDELKGCYQLIIWLGDRITGDVHFLLQNFIHCLNFFTMSKHHTHNQKRKIKLNNDFYVWRKKKIYFFAKERGSLGIQTLSQQKFISPKNQKANFGVFPFNLGNWMQKPDPWVFVYISSFSETPGSTGIKFSLTRQMETSLGFPDSHHFWPVESLKENLTACS